MPQSYTLHDLPPEERPRERLSRVGVNNLSLQELLALLIEKGGRNRNALQVAQQLLSHFGNLSKVKEASLNELQEVKGIGYATACKIKAALKLGEKAATPPPPFENKIKEAADVFQFLRREVGQLKKEHLKLLTLTSRHQLIRQQTISVGTLNSSVVHPREVFKPAISDHAAAVILAHNHPSQDPSPSESDLRITQRIIRAGELLGIKVVDHVIITPQSYFSFREENLL